MSRFPAPNALLQTNLVLQGGLYLLVASIPFEYPERTIPLEIPTLTGAVFLLVTLLYPKRCYGRLPAAALWFGAYVVIMLLCILLGQRERAAEALTDYVVLLQGVIVFLAAGNLMRDERVARRALVTLVAACSIRAALPLLGFGRTTSAVWTGGERISALGQNANSAAMILAAGLVALIGLILMHRRKTFTGLVFAGGLGILMGTAILETGSRGGLASLLGGVMVLALAADTWRQRLRNGAIALLAISLLTFAALQLPVMKNRLRDAATTGNLAGREQLFPALWNMFLEKPVLGWGPVTNNYELALRVGTRDRGSRAAHNLILELLSAGGLVLTITFSIGAWLSAQGAWRARRGDHGVLPLALLCSLFLANMSGEWGASKLLWLVLAYAVVSGRWQAPLLRSVPVRSRPWVMTLPSAVRD
ncbi:MAG TPA: O-antigen ligase family protein [Gemmatimonadales bacterium]|nr:O-antigen ligase family protein [Gemmatimonadales bacterium]